PQQLGNFYLPAAHAATFPWVSHALWFYSQMVRWGQIAFDSEHIAQVRATYRPDLYRLALAGVAPDIPDVDDKIEGAGLFGADGFFDDALFDSSDVPAYLRRLSDR